MKEFYLKQKALSRRHRYKVFDSEDNQLYHSKARFFSPSRKFDLYDSLTDEHLYQIKRKRFSFRPTYILYNTNGDAVAKAKRKRSFFKKLVTIESDFGDFLIEGNFWAHDFQILRDDQEVASIRKKRISFGDSYTISITDEENTNFFLALMIMIDSKFHQKKRKSGNPGGGINK